MRTFLLGATLSLLSVPLLFCQNPAEPADSTGNSLANYSYQLPLHWTERQSSGYIALTSPTYRNANLMARPMDPQMENCQITLLPMRPATRTLGEEAVLTFRQVFHTDPLVPNTSGPPTITNGISPQGWEYILIRKLIGGQEGEARTTGATFLMAKVGNQVATVIGVSRDFLWSACFGQQHGDAWPGFFYILQFRNAPPAAQAQAAIQQQFIGTWLGGTGDVGLAYVFQPDGHYSSVGGTRNKMTGQLIPSFQRDGTFALNNKALVLTANDYSRSAQFFRIGRISRDSGRSWTQQLCLFDPRNSGEICYDKR
ncbi:MAG TPA: hypothetical protein VHT24_13300 [Pseudacidobacterium sp.]|jgi:hypothetical protein|nr:hypothetical protein [Pseudacidobacterium sp.]